MPRQMSLELQQQQGSLFHTDGHIACPACEALRSELVFGADVSAFHNFNEAAALWLKHRELAAEIDRARFVARRTLKDNRQYVAALSRFFGNLTLNEIHAGHLRQYQWDRASGKLGLTEEEVLRRCGKMKHCSVDELQSNAELAAWAKQKVRREARRTVSGRKINQELGCLEQILTHANLWTGELKKAYKPLKVGETDVRRAMSPDEQARFLEVAASREAWQVAYWYCLVALHTTANDCELRGLKLGDVNLFEQVLQVRAASAKNKYRIRTIPLVQDALWALDRLLQRARALGSISPNDYLFPFHMGGEIWDPRRPMSPSGIKRAFEEIRKDAGVPWLRKHDLRHCAITRMAEAGMAIQVIMSIAGHISRKMLEHYTSISDQAKRKALTEVFEPKKPQKRAPGRESESFFQSGNTGLAAKKVGFAHR